MTKLLHRKGLHAYTHATLVSPVHLKKISPKRANGVIHLMMKNMPWDCVVSRHVFSMSTANRLPQFHFGPISRITDDRVTEFGAMVIKAAKEVTLAYGGMR